MKSEDNTTHEYFLFEENEDEDDEHHMDEDDNNNNNPDDHVGVCTRHTPNRRNQKMPRLMEKRTCTCAKCVLRYEIEFYLALNRSGRGSFKDLSIRQCSWSRIISKVSNDDPSLLFAMLQTQPDVPIRR